MAACAEPFEMTQVLETAIRFVKGAPSDDDNSTRWDCDLTEHLSPF